MDCVSGAVVNMRGMCTGLDPNYDLLHEMQPFTQSLLDKSSQRTKEAVGGPMATARGSLDLAGKLIRDFGTRLYKLPALADNVLAPAEPGDLTVKMTPDSQLKQQIPNIQDATSQIVFGMVFGALTLASTLLYISHEQALGIVGYGLSALTLIMLLARGRG